MVGLTHMVTSLHSRGLRQLDCLQQFNSGLLFKISWRSWVVVSRAISKVTVIKGGYSLLWGTCNLSYNYP